MRVFCLKKLCQIPLEILYCISSSIIGYSYYIIEFVELCHHHEILHYSTYFYAAGMSYRVCKVVSLGKCGSIPVFPIPICSLVPMFPVFSIVIVVISINYLQIYF